VAFHSSGSRCHPSKSDRHLVVGASRHAPVSRQIKPYGFRFPANERRGSSYARSWPCHRHDGARAGQGLRPEELTATRGTRGRSAIQIRSRLRCAGRCLHVERVAAHQRMRRRTVRRCQPCRGPILRSTQPSRTHAGARQNPRRPKPPQECRRRPGSHTGCAAARRKLGRLPVLYRRRRPEHAGAAGSQPRDRSRKAQRRSIPRPRPKRKMSAGTTAGPTTCLELCARPRAAIHETG
jgi:hypothetical protein